jgi:hypothetical protein
LVADQWHHCAQWRLDIESVLHRALANWNADRFRRVDQCTKHHQFLPHDNGALIHLFAIRLCCIVIVHVFVEFFQNGAATFSVFSDPTNVLSVKTGSQTLMSLDYSGNLYIGNAVMTNKNTSSVQYVLRFLDCLLASADCIFSVISFNVESLLLDANGDGFGLRMNYYDTPNTVVFPDLSGTVVLDSSTGVVTSQVCCVSKSMMCHDTDASLVFYFQTIADGTIQSADLANSITIRDLTVQNSLQFPGFISSTSTIDASTTSVGGALTTSGGAAIAKKLCMSSLRIHLVSLQSSIKFSCFRCG